MNAISVTRARDNIYRLMADVNANCQPITITNSKGRNAVLIGEDDWRAIEETLFLMSIPRMTESIIEGGNTPSEECLSEDEVEFKALKTDAGEAAAKESDTVSELTGRGRWHGTERMNDEKTS